MAMYTDPNRLRATDPGRVENNPLWIFHDVFNSDTTWVAEAKEKYRAGQIGDVECKKKLIDVITALLEPMQKRRKELLTEKAYVSSVLKNGAEKANNIANKTLEKAKEFIKQCY